MAARPPKDISADDFFRVWLPAQFAAEFGPGKRAAVPMSVAVSLEGPGGGEWLLDVTERALRVRGADEAGPVPQVLMRQPAADWRAAAVGEGDTIVAPPEASPLDVLFVDPSSRQMLQTVRGTVRFEIANYNGRTWWMQVKFGPQPEPIEPEATMAIDAADYAAILSSTLSPTEAYFGGKIRLTGNITVAMQLGMLLLPKFVRTGLE